MVDANAQPNIGSSLEDFLREEGILEQCEAAALQRLRDLMEQRAHLHEDPVARAKEHGLNFAGWGVFVTEGRYTNLSSDDLEDAQILGESHFTDGFTVEPMFTVPRPVPVGRSNEVSKA